ncbi:MAG: hypothetical protein J1G01_01010 [Clostridiales bacterium]|nr:hypothetical protein [Clostridiales bacterium]
MIKRLGVFVIHALCVLLCVFIFLACGENKAENDGKGMITGIFAADVIVDYDGRAHSINVENVLTTDKVYYSESENGGYALDTIEYVMPGEYTVYFRVVRAGYADYYGSADIIINRIILDNISANNVTVIYDGFPHGITIDGLLPEDVVEFSFDGIVFGDESTRTEVGEYTVFYRVSRAYGDYADSCTLTILPDLRGRYLNDERGLIVLTNNSAVIGDDEKPLTVKADGSGLIGDEQFTCNDGTLIFDEKEYIKLSDDDCVYMIAVGEDAVYVAGGDTLTVYISFADETATVAACGKTVMTIDGVNYCESADVRDYSTSDVELEFVADGSVSKVEIVLSMRPTLEVGDVMRRVVFDGKTHGFGIDFDGTVLYKTDGEYKEEAPSFTEVGEYAVDIVYLSDGYLPRLACAVLVIAPKIDGVYCNSDTVIVIENESATINGATAELDYTDGHWTINGRAVEIGENCIRFTDDGSTFDSITSGYVLLVCFGENTYVIKHDSKQITVEFDHASGKVTLNGGDTELLSFTIDADNITVSLNGSEIFKFERDGRDIFLIGSSDIGNNIVLTVVISA